MLGAGTEPIVSMKEELDLQLLRSARPWEHGCLGPASHRGMGGAPSEGPSLQSPVVLTPVQHTFCAKHYGEEQPHDHNVTLAVFTRIWLLATIFGCPVKGKGPSVPSSRNRSRLSSLSITPELWEDRAESEPIQGSSRPHGIFLSPSGQRRINRANCGEATKPRISAVRRWIYLWRQLLGGWRQEIPVPPNEDSEGKDHFRIFFLSFKKESGGNNPNAHRWMSR